MEQPWNIQWFDTIGSTNDELKKMGIADGGTVRMYGHSFEFWYDEPVGEDVEENETEQ
jgi:hypothetical protein